MARGSIVSIAQASHGLTRMTIKDSNTGRSGQYFMHSDALEKFVKQWFEGSQSIVGEEVSYGIASFSPDIILWMKPVQASEIEASETLSEDLAIEPILEDYQEVA